MLSPTPVAVPLLAAQRRQVAQADQLTTSSDLNAAQTALEVGQAIPIIFGLRTGGAGGVWVSPAASECRFENDTANRVTASYQLVLGDGQLATIPEGDIYQGDTPLASGDFLQNYNARAGTWAPGNFIQQRFSVTTTTTLERIEGKPIGQGDLLDVGEMTAAELAEHLQKQLGSIEIKSSGDYITRFKIEVAKAISWPTSGTVKATKGPEYGAVQSGGGGSGTITVSPEWYDSQTWTLTGDTGTSSTYDPQLKFRPYNALGLEWSAANQWVHDRANSGRYINTSQYEVTRTASTQPYGDLAIQLVETVQGGFLLTQTASISLPAGGGTYTTSIFGGLAGATYDLTITEENSEPLPKPEATLYCGTGGSYANLSTLSITRQYPAGDEGWRRQVHAFLRAGRPVPRLIEGTEGASNLFPDLARFALLASGQITADLIDDASLLASARFHRANDITCDGVAAVPANVPEWLDRLAPLFLLRPTNAWGRIGLRPALPVTPSHGLNLSPLVPVMVFDESNMSGGMTIEGIPAEDRNWRVGILPLWREQPDNNIGTTRGTGPVRYADMPDSSPVEEVDGSEWLTRERHALQVAALELARRRHVEHRGTFQIYKPTPAHAALRPGDIIRINRARIPTIGNPSDWSYLYEITSISGHPMGPWTIAVDHHPVDINGASLLAREVAGAILS